MHKSQKPYKCDKCSKGFLNTSGLEGHKRKDLVKKEENCRPPECEGCEKSNGPRTRLRGRHKMYHLGKNKPIEHCRVCRNFQLETMGTWRRKSRAQSNQNFRRRFSQKLFVPEEKMAVFNILISHLQLVHICGCRGHSERHDLLVLTSWIVLTLF